MSTTTPALQAAYNTTKDLEGPPIVFNAVTSPYDAGVAAAADDHPSWVIGYQALAPVEDALALIPRLMPDIQTVGYIYNPAEANSVVNTEIAEPAAESLGLTLEVTQISNSSEVQAAAEALVAIFRRDREWNEGAARKKLLELFDAWGPKDPATAKGRRLLSAALFS